MARNMGYRVVKGEIVVARGMPWRGRPGAASGSRDPHTNNLRLSDQRMRRLKN